MVRVFCLEGNWRPDNLELSESLEPLLQLVQRHRLIEYIRRDIATRAELEYYLGAWGKRKYENYQFAYLAFHGTRGRAVFLDDDSLSLNELGQLLREQRAGKDAVIHLGSCYGMKVTEEALEAFLAETRAWAVSGYTKQVDTMEAAAFELLLFNSLGGPWREIGARYEALDKRYPDVRDHVGFAWKSD
jgi:hypothetical protein